MKEALAAIDEIMLIGNYMDDMSIEAVHMQSCE